MNHLQAKIIQRIYERETSWPIVKTQSFRSEGCRFNSNLGKMFRRRGLNDVSLQEYLLTYYKKP